MASVIIRLISAGLAGLTLLLSACPSSFTRTVGEGGLTDGSGGSGGGNSESIAGGNSSGSYFWYGGDSAGNGWFGTEGIDYSDHGDTGGVGGPYEAVPGYCGDGIVNVDGEQCDGNDLGGQSCESLGEGQGDLHCFAASCTFDVSMCFRVDDFSPPGSTPVPSPDYPSIRPPATPEECIELFSILQPAIPFVIPEPNLDCLCRSCLEPFGQCMVDYYCAQVVSCCVEEGLRDADCQLSNYCSGVITEAFEGGSDSIFLALDVSNCAAPNCSPTP